MCGCFATCTASHPIPYPPIQGVLLYVRPLISSPAVACPMETSPQQRGLPESYYAACERIQFLLRNPDAVRPRAAHDVANADSAGAALPLPLPRVDLVASLSTAGGASKEESVGPHRHGRRWPRPQQQPQQQQSAASDGPPAARDLEALYAAMASRVNARLDGEYHAPSARPHYPSCK